MDDVAPGTGRASRSSTRPWRRPWPPLAGPAHRGVLPELRNRRGIPDPGPTLWAPVGEAVRVQPPALPRPQDGKARRGGPDEA